MKRTFTILAIAALLFGTAACGDDSDDTGGQPDNDAEQTTSTEGDTSTTTTAASTTTGASEDAQRAQQALLTAQDFPAGWTAAPGESNDNDDSETDFSAPECAHIAALENDAALEAELEDDAKATFVAPNGTASVRHSITIADPAAIDQYIAAYASDQTIACFQVAFAAQMEQSGLIAEGATVQDLSVQHVPVDVGEASVGLQIAVTVATADGRAQVSYEVEQHVVRVGGAGSALTVTVGPGAESIDVAALDAASVERLSSIA